MTEVKEKLLEKLKNELDTQEKQFQSYNFAVQSEMSTRMEIYRRVYKAMNDGINQMLDKECKQLLAEKNALLVLAKSYSEAFVNAPEI